MTKDILYYVEENEKLIREKELLDSKLNEHREIIDAIKLGKFDVVISAENEQSKVLSPQNSNDSYRKFIENMSEGVITIDNDGVIVYSNTSFAGMFNLPPEQVTGRNLSNFIPREYVRKSKLLFVENAQNNSKLEVSIVDHLGINRYYIVSLNKLQLAGFLAINLVWTDVTDKKNIENELTVINKNLSKAIKAWKVSESEITILNNKLKISNEILKETNLDLSTFAHIASHDLQEPLRKIMTYSSSLLHNHSGLLDVEAQNSLNSIQKASNRMSELIKDILEYSSVAQKDVMYEHINLQDILDEVLTIFEVLIKDTGAIISVPRKLPFIQANPAQMKQLFINLISNALKFKKDDSKPEISIDGVGPEHEIIRDEEGPIRDYCKIVVSDNGIGFDPEYNTRIFTIFQRLNSASKYPGTGVGLSICKKIIERHHGFIQATGIPGSGAVFTITLPSKQ